MKILPSALALALLVPSAAQAQEAERDPRLAYALRCSAAFAILANEQGRGVEAALAYPDVQLRGREFFVRTAAALMDAEGLTRDGVAAEMRREAESLQAEAAQAPDRAAHQQEVLGPCLALLDTSLPALLPPPQ